MDIPDSDNRWGRDGAAISSNEIQNLDSFEIFFYDRFRKLLYGFNSPQIFLQFSIYNLCQTMIILRNEVYS